MVIDVNQHHLVFKNARNSIKIKTNFKPFVMLEDDVKKDNYPDNIEIPDDCDLFYLGHSKI